MKSTLMGLFFSLTSFSVFACIEDFFAGNFKITEHKDYSQYNMDQDYITSFFSGERPAGGDYSFNRSEIYGIQKNQLFKFNQIGCDKIEMTHSGPERIRQNNEAPEIREETVSISIEKLSNELVKWDKDNNSFVVKRFTWGLIGYRRYHITVSKLEDGSLKFVTKTTGWALTGTGTWKTEIFLKKVIDD